jgi:SAM-dependent methyltransferase
MLVFISHFKRDFMFGLSPRSKAIHGTYKLFGKELGRDGIASLDKALSQFQNDFDLVNALLLTKDGLDTLLSRADSLHLFIIHNARMKMAKNLLPKGDIILDLGGANSPLYEMGYPHDFSKLVLIDLPTEERHQEFQVELRGGYSKVFLRYEDMTDLKGIESDSIDLVWSGQSIEHVSLEQGERMCKEAFRVLKPGGRFCLDTPNRLITELHTATVGGGFIHPDHKLEYTPEQLRSVLTAAGFSIAEAWGICEMPMTAKNKEFSYEDFIIGGAISRNIDDCYMQFFETMKPLG